jgi:hypothetical protein
MDHQTIADCLAETDQAGFAQRLRAALLALPAGTLPLAEACTQGGLVDESDLALSVLSSEHSAQAARARVGVFFSERVGGCNCHDDPLDITAYAVIEVRLDRAAGCASYRCVSEA